MLLKYNFNVNEKIIENSLVKITNQIYKLLPYREEQLDWKKPLDTIIEQLVGLNSLLPTPIIFPIVCKLEGLRFYDKEEDFLIYRRTIFECLNMLNEVVKNGIE